MATRVQEQYFDDIVDLRLALHLNAGDDEFSTHEHGEIRYVFDSNIAIFFLNPINELELVNFFQSSDDDGLLPTALATAEYLFSGKLCGQRLRPPMITSAHMDHVIGHVASIEERAAHALGSESEEIEAHQIDLGEYFRNQSADDAKKYTEAFIASLAKFRQAPKGVLSLMHALESFRRMFSEELIAPLDFDTFYSNQIPEKFKWVSQSLFKEVKEYKKLELDYKKEIKKAKNKIGYINYSEVSNKSIKTDVDAILQVMALNENAKYSAKPIKYVFVTADKALFEAYANWYWQNFDSDQNAPFVVRRISQFIPLLNVRDMPNKIGLTLIPNIRESLDSMLTNVRNRDKRTYPDYLATYAGIHKRMYRMGNSIGKEGLKHKLLKDFDGLLMGPMKDNPREVKNLQSMWFDLMTGAGALNMQLLYARDKSLDALRSILGGDDFRKSAIKWMRDTLDNVAFVHARLALVRNLHSLISPIDDKPNYESKVRQNPRGFNFLRIDFGKFTSGRPIGEFLITLMVRREVQGSEIKKISDNLLKTRDYKAMLFASCCAFANGAWPAAYNYSQRSKAMYLDACKKGLETLDDLTYAELQIFYATTLRHNIMNGVIKNNYSKLPELEKLLEDALNKFKAANDIFGQALVKSELAYLRNLILYDYYAVDGDTPDFSIITKHFGSLQDMVAESWVFLREADELMSANDHLDTTEGLRISLRLHIKTLQAGWHILCAAYPLINCHNDDRDLSEVIAALKKEKKGSKFHPLVYNLAIPLLELVNESEPLEKNRQRNKVFKQLTQSAENYDGTTISDRLIMAGLKNAPGLNA